MAAGTEGSLRVAFVSAPGTSVFMVELLDAVAEAVRALGRDLEVVTRRGFVSEVVDSRTVAVVVPHEYYVLAPPEPESLRARTVSFGVEHPGTDEFEVSARYAATVAARFEISASSVAALAGRGVAAEHFELGPAPGWDRRAEVPERDVDVVYLGTADPRRLGILAAAARDLAGLRTELVVVPHEQMTGPRPDFLAGRDKWRLLARSKVLVNLHRGTKTSLEWVRVLEAVANGCAVVSEPSDDLEPLTAGTHLVVAEPAAVGLAAGALARDEPRRARLADAALERCRTELDLAGSAARLADACARAVASAPDPEVVAPAVAGPPGHHRAVWLPAPGGGPPAPPGLVPAALAARSAVPSGASRLAVLCTRLPGDGRVGATVASVAAELPGVPVHVRRGGETAHRGAARNRLAEACDEELLAVLDAGDAVLGDALARMAELLRADPGLDAVLCPATYGGTLVNLVLPETERLRERVYLTRGYVVRRQTLEALGGFTEEPELADLVDHHFWLSLTAGGGRTAVLRSVGVALRPP